jgi:hypothetical protein
VSKTAQLVALIHQIRNATSPLGRVKMVALAWRSLRGMSLPDRMAVAKEIGLEGAEKLVEKMADRGGISPSVVLSAIHKAEKSGATTPTALLGELLGGAAEELAQPSGEVEVPAEPAFETGFEPLPGETAPVQEAAGIDEAPIDPAGAAISDDLFPQEPEQVADPEQEAKVAEATEPEPVTDREPIPPSVSPAPAAPVPERTVAATVTEERQGSTGDSPLLDDLNQEGFLIRRLQLLDRRIEETRKLGRQRLLQLIEQFPAGWSRRRALETLLRAGVPAQLEDVLALVELLQRPSERLWVLTTLAAARKLTAGEGERLVNATRQQALQRRLRIRLSVGSTE